MTTPLSIRFTPSLLARLGSVVAVAAGLTRRLIRRSRGDDDHPGVIFKDGPSGRRAALAY